MRLILVRHAPAAPGAPDALRPLTAVGQLVAREVGERLAAKHPDAVVSSPLLRACQTAEEIAEAAGLTALIDDRVGPGATVESVRAAVAERGEVVVVVAHQPDCGEIVLALTGETVTFPPGGVAELDL